MDEQNKDSSTYGNYRYKTGLNYSFNTIFGIPDYKHLDDRFTAAVAMGAFAGFNYGMFGTIIKAQPKLSISGSLGRFGYYAIRSGQGAMQGGVMGALYAVIVTGSCKLRDNKDDSLNHFLGGFGLSTPYLIKGNFNSFIVYGVIAGVLGSAVKSLYINNFQFSKRSSDKMMNCRYPEIYVARAPLPEEFRFR